MYLKWNDKWNTGLRFIDEQHFELVALVNELYEASNRGIPKEVAQAAENLSDFAQIHFTTEEWFFKKFGYPDRFEHIKQHRVLGNSLLGVVEKGKITPQVYGDAMMLAKEWLTQHFMKTDIEFAKFLKKILQTRYQQLN